MKTLPTLSQLPARTTKGDLIDLVAPQVPYDMDLPQDWVNLTRVRGFDPRGQVVLAYPPGYGYVCGVPMPLTTEARTALIGLGVSIWEDPE